jgi:cytochrome c biogenesis protein CcmG/thiol:disulfide interchange protein DsbE
MRQLRLLITAIISMLLVTMLVSCAKPNMTLTLTPSLSSKQIPAQESTSPTILLGTSPEVGALAPDFTLSTLDGSSVTLSAYRGKPILLNLWATWCGPCRAEMPYLQEVFEERLGEGLVLLTVNLREDETTVKQFMQTEGYTFMVALDRDGAVGNRYSIRGIPTTFFIDSAGVIRSIHIGSFSNKSQILAELEQMTEVVSMEQHN